MKTQLNILIFYVILTLILMTLSWNYSSTENKMPNTISWAAVGISVSSLLWQNYGRHMVY